MAWDENAPVGTDAIKQGDNEIRTFKVDVRSALAEEHEALTYVAAAPKARHKFGSGASSSKPTADAALRRIFLSSDKNRIEVENLGLTLPAGSPAWYGGGAPIMVRGTVMLFYQSAAPTGWTQVTTHNDKIMRVVSSTGGGSGGTTALTSAFSGQTTGSEASHTHGVSGSGDTSAANLGASGGQQFAAGSGIDHRHSYSFSVTSDAGSSHSHTIPNFAPQYIDVIICSMD